ncbi:uncharacterized protein LOC144350695 [Saccoglossus kowalevskii]
MSGQAIWRGFKICWSRNCPCFDCFTGDCSGVCMVVICTCTIGVSFTLIGIFVMIKGYVVDNDPFVQVVGLVELCIGLFFCFITCLGVAAFSHTRRHSPAVKLPPEDGMTDLSGRERPPSSDFQMSVIQNGVTPTGTTPCNGEELDSTDEVPPTPPLIGETPLEISVHSEHFSDTGSVSSHSELDNPHTVVLVRPRHSIVSLNDDSQNDEVIKKEGNKNRLMP